MIIDRVVACRLDSIHWVLSRPAHEHVELPLREARVFRSVEDMRGFGVRVPRADLVLVARSHIEIDACQVALDLVVRLEYLSGIAAGAASSHLAVAVCRLVGDAVRVYLAERQVASAVVDIAVGGNDVVAVALHRCLLREPALRHGVFAVVALPLVVVRMVLRRSADDVAGGVGVPVAQIAVGTFVALVVHLQQGVVAGILVFVDNLAEGRLQGTPLASVSPGVVVVSVVGSLRTSHQPQQRRDR